MERSACPRPRPGPMPMPPSAERERQPERPSRYQPGDLDLHPFVEELEKSFGNRRGA